MNNQNKIKMATFFGICWLIIAVVLDAFISPLMGAATVAQLDATDNEYSWLFSVMSAGSLAQIVVAVIFIILISLTLRNKKYRNEK
jgi:uncharacterized membrane protein